MQYISRYYIAPKQDTAFRAWLLESESAMREHGPEGWSYLGTWFTVMGFGKFDCESRWEVDGYDTLDAGWGNETHQKLMREWFGFMDQSREGEVYLMKSTSDVRVFE